MTGIVPILPCATGLQNHAVGQPVNFYTVTEAAHRRGETAIGYRLMSESHDAEKSYGVHTNPKKSERVNFSAEDKIIVISEG
jgi:hypothetical protein